MTSNTISSERYSPMECLPVENNLSPYGLPIMDSDYGEVELACLDNVQLRIEDSLMIISEGAYSVLRESTSDWIDCDSDLVMTLTTHRIILRRKSLELSPRFIHLSVVNQANSSGGGFLGKGKHKISLKTYSYGTIVLVFQKGSSAKQKNNILTGIEKCVDRRRWEGPPRAFKEKKAESPTKRIRPVFREEYGVSDHLSV